jgi:hypothetical protein
MVGFGLAGSANAQTVSFNDTFANGSTIDASSPGAVTSNSTNYTLGSTKTAGSPTSTIGSGDLHLAVSATTTSAFAELQANFVTAGSTAYSLVNTGDTIEADVTFTEPTAGLLLTSGSNLCMGLYNSGGTAPESGATLANAGLSSATGSAFATGGTQLWQGYFGQILGSGGSSSVRPRPQQNTANATSGPGSYSANQELLEDGIGGGAFTNPTSAQIGSTTASTLSLATGTTYTADMLITDLGSGSISLVETLYNGTGPSGTALQTITVASTAALVTTFDGLAFGFDTKSSAAVAEANISDISVVYTPAAVPEPTGLGLIAVGSGIGLLRRKRPRAQSGRDNSSQ